MNAFAVASFYALGACALVALAIFNEHTSRAASSSSHSYKVKYAHLDEAVEFGILASDTVEHRTGMLLQNQTAFNSFQYNPESPDYPSWLPIFFQNGWAILFIAISMSLILALLVLGQRNISKKWDGWVKWFHDNENIRNGLMYPQFPINVMNGVFAVVGPILVLRDLELDPSLLGALIFAEHATQVLTQLPCGEYVDTAGHKAAQRRAVILLSLAAACAAALPLLPAAWIMQGPWHAFALYLAARLLFAWGTNQFDANYNAAINNSAFLPPHDAPRALDLFYCSAMLGAFVGSVLALVVVQAVRPPRRDPCATQDRCAVTRLRGPPIAVRANARRRRCGEIFRPCHRPPTQPPTHPTSIRPTFPPSFRLSVPSVPPLSVGPSSLPP